jgi:ABC-type spermidine/putrescine transport system permease subunit I
MKLKNVRIPISIIPAVTFLLVLFIAPFITLTYYSFLTIERANIIGGPSLLSYQKLLSDPYTYYLFGRTILLSFVVVVFCLILGYPLAFIVTRTRSPILKTILLVCIAAPLLTSALVRTFGWIAILGRFGLANQLLTTLGLIDQPIRILFTMNAVLIGMIQIHLPFMIVPLLSTLGALPSDLNDAAIDLGASQWQTFWRIILPQSIPGISAGVTLVFTLSYTSFTVPTLMGGEAIQIVSPYIWNNVRLLNWSTAAATSSLLLITSLAIVILMNMLFRRLAPWQYLRN